MERHGNSISSALDHRRETGRTFTCEIALKKGDKWCRGVGQRGWQREGERFRWRARYHGPPPKSSCRKLFCFLFFKSISNRSCNLGFNVICQSGRRDGCSINWCKLIPAVICNPGSVTCNNIKNFL